jgi:cob(I)alamin adenosyltransferase
MARILVFTGNGKGKTTAALGLAVRALGHGLRVWIRHFVKSDAEVGEFRFLSAIDGLTISQCGQGFLPRAGSPALQPHRQAAEEGWQSTLAEFAENRHDIYILDELCIALDKKLLPEEEVLQTLTALPESCVVVVTGRGASARLCEAADTVTEMMCRKHAYEAGIPAQVGVEK